MTGIPHEVSKLLGSEAMNGLVLNQNRLVGVEDLYNSLVSIIEPRLKNIDADLDGRLRKSQLRGLVKPVPLNRTCKKMKKL